MKVYLNNKFIDEEKATINIKDRGLLLGDSIFDTLLYNVFMWQVSCLD